MFEMQLLELVAEVRGTLERLTERVAILEHEPPPSPVRTGLLAFQARCRKNEEERRRA